MMNRPFLLFTFLLITSAASAHIRLPAVISDNMVLQQKSSVQLWGWGDPGEKVRITTSWNQRTDSTVVDGNAKWKLEMNTPSAGGPFTITINGNNTIELKNVLVGEVWVCSGQSNMEMNYYWGLPQMKADIPNAYNSNIRFFHIPRSTAAAPQEHGEGNWVVCDTNNVKHFSAVAYYFGKKLQEELNVPIGLIHSSWGGTPAEAWTPAEVVLSSDTLLLAAQQLKASPYWPTSPGFAFNGMLAPVTPFRIAGTIWYQGESNTGTASTYQQLFTSMIKAWRRQWNTELPFYFVQLAPYNYGNNRIGAFLREAQLHSLSLPGTGMVVTTDLADDTTDIHPRNKRDVGLRLANLALSKTYGQTSLASESPMFDEMRFLKNRIILSFHHAPNGLMQKGKTIQGFMIAGPDRVFYQAQAKIENNEITVWHPSVKQPVAVRYAFTNTAIGNVFSKEGLPLAPFRTDEWNE